MSRTYIICVVLVVSAYSAPIDDNECSWLCSSLNPRIRRESGPAPGPVSGASEKGDGGYDSTGNVGLGLDFPQVPTLSLGRKRRDAVDAKEKSLGGANLGMNLPKVADLIELRSARKRRQAVTFDEWKLVLPFFQQFMAPFPSPSLSSSPSEKA